MSETPSHHTATGFRNPWDSALPPTWTETLSNPLPLEWARAYLTTHPEVKDLDLLTPDWGLNKSAGEDETKTLKSTWIGHASVFVEMPAPRTNAAADTVKILFDPIFSLRAGPTQYTGPRRLWPAPCQVKDLPGCDIVCISHNHYDHLDLPSIVAIHERFPSARYFVPLGNKSWFQGTKIPESQVVEMDWWDAHHSLSPYQLTKASEDVDPGAQDTECQVRITCVPAQHNTGRGTNDYSRTLWCGWVIEQKALRGEAQKPERCGAVYFAGDTGYRRYSHSTEICPAFAEIGEKFGPLDLSLIPIWRGGTLSFLSWAGLRLAHETTPSAFHASPADAVAIHLDVRSRNSIGIHFGTFVGAMQETLEAMIELKGACLEEQIGGLFDDDEEEGEKEIYESKGRMGVVNLGQTWVGQIETRAWNYGE